MSRTIAPNDLQGWLASNDALMIIDVRRVSDYEQDPAVLPGAMWRDPGRVDEWSGELPADQDVVIYCVRGGSVSNFVLEALLERGVRARFIEGGIEAWKAEGGTTERR